MSRTYLSRLKKDFIRNKLIYFMLIPVVLYYAIFQYGPMYGSIIAFKNYDIVKGVRDSPWVGFENFVYFFNSIHFWRVVKNTLLINVYQLIFAFTAPILLALLLNEITRSWFKRLVQTITYIPHFISIVVVCGMLTQFLARDGVVTDIFVWFGGERTALLGAPEYFRTIFVASDIWQNIGWGTIIYLAALSSINLELYEAATVDGAGRFKKMLHITIPGLLPIIVILLILNIGKMMDVGYEKIILLYNPLTYETADVINSYVYRVGLGGSFQFSYAAAVGLFQSALNLSLLIFANWFSRKINDTSLW